MDSAAPPPHNVLEYFEITEDDFVHIIRRDTLGEAKGATPHETSNTPSPERPAYTTTITLKHHTDEVWNLRWSHDGAYLATCGKDGRLLVWKLGPRTGSCPRQCNLLHDLSGHYYPVATCAWSLDDSILISAADNAIMMWDAKKGISMRSLQTHTETVTALQWLPNNTGFISGGMDYRIISWNTRGDATEEWSVGSIRITDLAVTPDQSHLLAIGMQWLKPGLLGTSTSDRDSENQTLRDERVPSLREDKLVLFNLASKKVENFLELAGEPTSVQITADSRYAIVNHAPHDLIMYDLLDHCIIRSYAGFKQLGMVIRSCFGGIGKTFVASGSEDGKVYVWNRDSEALLCTLAGHKKGSVNAVAWNPQHHGLFASCSDDNTIRIWESAGASADDF